MIALWLVFLGEGRVVVSVHCYGRHRWFYRLAARLLHGRMYWLSPAMRRYYGLEGEGWRQCIPGCVPPGASGAFPPTRPRMPGAVRVGGVGTLVEWKRWELVIEALGRLPETLRRQVTFEHLGGPDGTRASQLYASKLRQLARMRGVESQVRWRGVEPSSVALLAGIDALVIASHNEPFSVAMLEALARGIPVIAADSGGAVDVISVGRNGWIFHDGDPVDLARIIGALTLPQAWQGISIRAEESARFAASTVAGEWGVVYDRLP